MKTALVIGAGTEALPAIDTAKKAGYLVVALDGDENAKGLAAADASYVLDIRDADGILRLLEKENIRPDIILPVPVGRILTSTGAVNDALGLRGVSLHTATLCTDKYAFHDTLASADLRPAELLLLPAGTDERVLALFERSLDGLKEILHATPMLPAELSALASGLVRIVSQGFPVVLKPRFGSGNRGLHICETAAELTKALSPMLPLSEDMIIETFVAGEEYGADVCVFDGDVRLVLLRKKELAPLPSRQCTAYTAVERAGEGKALYGAVTALMVLAAGALGVTDALCHADLILREDGAWFPVEFSARPSGHMLSAAFVKEAAGVDMVRSFLFGELQAEDGSAPTGDIKSLTIRYDVSPEETARSGGGYRII